MLLRYLERMTEIVAPMSLDKRTLVSVEEFAKFSQYKKLQNKSSLVTTLVESGKACLMSSSNKRVINSGATDHMTGILIYILAFDHTKQSLL